MSATVKVRSMYESHPYPSPQADSLIPAVADILCAWFKGDDFAGKKILEAGCGSGHRLVGVADRYPKAEVLGVDISRTSLQVGRNLAKKHGVNNISFKEGNLLELDLGERFDLITCTGVIHHTENPALSLRNVCKHLSDKGTIFIWVYHAFGEHDRLLERELLNRLWIENRDDFEKGIELMNELSFDLDSKQYSGEELCPEGQQNRQTAAGISKNVDAYLNPIVNAYRTESALRLFADCNVDWVAVEGFSTVGAYKAINLSDFKIDPLRDFFSIAQNESFFRSEKLLNNFEKLDNLGKLAVIELLLRPTGIGIVAGKGDSYKEYPKCIEGNIVSPIAASGLDSNYMVCTDTLDSRR